MRLAFMGTPDFAVPTLRALIAAGHEVAAVYTQPARPAGRGKALRPSPVAEAAEGLAVRTPERFRAPAVLAEFQRLDLDAAVVIAYGQILQPDALAAPKLGCINLHASLLPRWRGAAPIQRAIMAGDAETGVGVMQMEAGLDTGPVFLEQRTQIEATDTAGTLHDRLAEMSAALIVEALPRIANGTLAATPQASAGISYASKIDKAEARIDWTRTADDVDRQIRGLSPFPGAWCEIGGQRVKVLLSALAEGDGPPGTVLDDNLTIACGSGAVRLLRVQRAGKGAVSAQQYLNAAPLAEGTVLT